MDQLDCYLLAEILSWTQWKDLYNVSLVCSAWHSVTSDPAFREKIMIDNKWQLVQSLDSPGYTYTLGVWGKYLFSNGNDQYVRVWQKSGDTITPVPDKRSVSGTIHVFHQWKNLLLGAGRSSYLYFWTRTKEVNEETGCEFRPMSSITLPTNVYSQVKACKTWPDYFAPGDDALLLCGVTKGDENVRVSIFKDSGDPSTPIEFVKHVTHTKREDNYSMEIWENKLYLGGKGVITVFDKDFTVLLQIQNGTTEEIRTLHLNPSRDLMFSSGWDKCIRAYDSSNQLVREWTAHSDVIFRSVWIGELIASIGHDGFLRVWTQKGKQIHEMVLEKSGQLYALIRWDSALCAAGNAGPVYIIN
eukprot:TRINITY_DN12940_c0_g1_i1.p1 TRINITY_DN12940_c0_g1~~TRINITY_DN12940_c0_g1_i1.p1  ORF type:complete len:358 (+),score=50.04 TRINITY_DN12940_c0_g1_i1:39-1112(+)